jgi:hypothetical protein
MKPPQARSHLPNMTHLRTVIILLIVFIFTVVLVIGPDYSNTPLIDASLCVETPDASHTIRYNGLTYRRIRQNTPIFTAGIPIHFKPTISVFDGKLRKAYLPWYEGDLDSKYINWRPQAGINLLLFVDKTESLALVTGGYRNFDIYIRPLSNGQYILPTFITSYCAGNYLLNKLTLKPDTNGNYFPPTSIDTTALNWQFHSSDPALNIAPNISPYYILAYDFNGSPTWSIIVNGEWPTADLTVTENGNTKDYTAYYINQRYIFIIDKSDQALGYRYTYPDVDFTPSYYYSSPSGGPTYAELQMQTFNNSDINPWGWWNPECKPAIYLYPKKELNVHVSVNPAGYLTFSDPVYPINGWKIRALTDGTIISSNKRYPYLYYESRILDSAIDKPTAGYVVAYQELPMLFDTLLPKLGLVDKEIKDFKDYWVNKLTQAKFYFVGVMEKEAIDKIEPLTISPKEDTIIRVRLYFQPLTGKTEVIEPVITPQQRKGFTVVEWGGLVKTDKNHPFICSQ